MLSTLINEHGGDAGNENNNNYNNDNEGDDEGYDTNIISMFESSTQSWFTDFQKVIIHDVSIDLKNEKHVCILGSKGCGKSYMLNEIGKRYGATSSIRIMPLYQEMTARDLLQRRSTTSTSEEQAKEGRALDGDQDDLSSTTWQDSPLITAAKNGDICILDG